MTEYITYGFLVARRPRSPGAQSFFGFFWGVEVAIFSRADGQASGQAGKWAWRWDRIMLLFSSLQKARAVAVLDWIGNAWVLEQTMGRGTINQLQGLSHKIEPSF